MTIEADARDFDDAVWVKRLADDAASAFVAIADVAHYVSQTRTGPRGQAARIPVTFRSGPAHAARGAVQRLVQPGQAVEDRGCLVADMRIDREGQLIHRHFRRGIMRSAARLTYERVEAALGEAGRRTAPLVEPLLTPLRDAFEVLGRPQRRGR